jgi:hypothetical protein
MYKCVDERGRITYSDKPRPDCKGGKEVDIRGSPPMGEAVRERKSDLSQEEADFKRRQIDRERQEEQAKKELQQRCARARSEFNRLSNARRVIEKYDEKGQRVFLEDSVREERLARLRDELRGCP